MHDPADIGRRAILAGVAASAVAAATPALAQFPSLPGGLDVGRLTDLAGQVSGVIAGMKLTEADELAMGAAYYEPFIEQSGGRCNSRLEQEALHRFAEPLIATTKRSGLPWDISLIDNETV